MKTKSMLKSIALIVAIGCLCHMAVGCKTSQSTLATKASGVVVVTVDTGMKAWAEYVKAGKATQSQVDLVHKAYDAYYTAALADEAVLIQAVATTNSIDASAATASLANAEGALLILLNQYLPK